MPKIAVYVTSRNHPLLYTGELFDKPMLTLENYDKWYGAHLVMPDGSVVEVPSKDLVAVTDKFADARWIDHLLHPRLLYRLARHLDAYIDIRAIEVAAGRWMIEHIEDDSHNFNDPYFDEFNEE